MVTQGLTHPVILARRMLKGTLSFLQVGNAFHKLLMVASINIPTVKDIGGKIARDEEEMTVWR